MIPYADKNKNSDSQDNSHSSLPDGLEIKESEIPQAGLGVFASKEFDIGVRFGPYQGKKVRPDIPRKSIDTSYMWEVRDHTCYKIFMNICSYEYTYYMHI